MPDHRNLAASSGRSRLSDGWLHPSVSCSPFRYCETISEVLTSVRKMEESLKRLKQARKGAATAATAGANGGPTDDGKIRLQLALDVEYLGEQVGPQDPARDLPGTSQEPERMRSCF